MKKFLLLTLMSSILSLLVACGEEAVEEVEKVTADVSEQKLEPTEVEAEEEQPIEVDKGLLNVEVTIPSSLVEDQDIEQTITAAKDNGVKEVIQNEDGSLTYKMSKSTHQEMMKEMEESVIETIEDIKSSGDYASIVDVTSNNSFSEFTMVVDQEAFENSFDGFATFGLGITGLYYQLFNGVDPDKFKTTINLENAETGEVFNTIVYPDDLEE